MEARASQRRRMQKGRDDAEQYFGPSAVRASCRNKLSGLAAVGATANGTYRIFTLGVPLVSPIAMDRYLAMSQIFGS